MFLLVTSVVAYFLFRRCKKTDTEASPRTSSTRQLSPSLSDGYSGRQISITPEQCESNTRAYTFDYNNGSLLAITWPTQQYLPIPSEANIIDDGDGAIAKVIVIPNSCKRSQVQIEDRSQSQLEYMPETHKKTVEIPSIQQQTTELPRVDEPRQIVISSEQHTSNSHEYTYIYDNENNTLAITRAPQQLYPPIPNEANIFDDGDCAIAQVNAIPNSCKRSKIQIEDRSESQVEYIQETHKKTEEFRRIQQQIIERPRVDEQFSLLICVDATPKYIGGYCVDFITKICYCYTFNIDMLPWDLEDVSSRGNSAEFEMKNLLFALLLWEDAIKTCSQLQIHTDNFAIKPYVQDKYGMRASDFLRHLEQCEGIEMNKNIYINSKRNPEDFAKYITPADDLSRRNIAECQTFLSKVHGIEKFAKSHTYNWRPEVAGGPNYTPTCNYTAFINKVKDKIRYWNTNPCQQCYFTVEDKTRL